jgi:hypothetical protein
MFRLVASLAAVVLGVGLLVAAPAAAAGEHCQSGAYCLFSGTDYTGTSAAVPAGLGCHAVSTLGFPVAHSAARGFGDGYALLLYADGACTTSLGNVNSDVPNTSAAGYRLVPIPSGVTKNHCAAQGFCLFSFTDYQGVSKAVNMAPGCHSVIPLGLQWASSAARGLGDGFDLLLFADYTCHSVFDKLTTADLPDTFAEGYEVVPVST